VKSYSSNFFNPAGSYSIFDEDLDNRLQKLYVTGDATTDDSTPSKSTNKKGYVLEVDTSEFKGKSLFKADVKVSEFKVQKRAKTARV
jgi:hypothetical protein